MKDVSFAESGTKLGEMWRSLSPQDKAPFLEEHKKVVDAWQEEADAWRKANPHLAHKYTKSGRLAKDKVPGNKGKKRQPLVAPTERVRRDSDLEDADESGF